MLVGGAGAIETCGYLRGEAKMGMELNRRAPPAVDTSEVGARLDVSKGASEKGGSPIPPPSLIY